MEIVRESCDDVVTDMESSFSPIRDPESSAEKNQGNSESIDDDCATEEFKEVQIESEQALPVLQKMSKLSTKIQDLKKEQIVLSEKVKGITDDPFPEPEVVNTLRLLSAEYQLLKKKYIEEFVERKRLYNEIIELKGNIRVFCRCRPLNEVEITNGSASVVEMDSTRDTELQILCSDSKKTFKFDNVFKPDDTQDTVFAQTKPIVISVMDGYNVCIFAYGQTGTGKTFTMEGTPESRGVNYKTLEELFRITGERSGVMRYQLSVSMLEVYNEKIRDLLVESSNQPPKRLDIKQAADGTQEVPGLVETHVYSTEEVWELLKAGTRGRSIGSTSANEQSSRSHCLLRVTVNGENLINGLKTRSNLWLVDLAGSERVGRIEVEGERLKESQYINKSLSALGDVIYALASKTSHVPYRNSKLTHMLQSSLGGDCKTLMFVQISPSVADVGETLCSLNFATRVRGVESGGPARKQADFNEVLKYKQMTEKLKHEEKENYKLQENVKSLQLKLSARDHICRNLQAKVRDLENQLTEDRRTRLKQATISHKQPAQKVAVEKRKPPLGPSKTRMPLRSISNMIAPAASAQTRENFYSGTSASTKEVMKPRRISMAIRHPTTEIPQPKRRVSIATLRPESSLVETPIRTTDSQNRKGGAITRQSFLKDPRKSRYSISFNPLPEFRMGAEAPPTASSSKFKGSPTHASYWKSTLIPLQRKPVVWSPLKKTLDMKANRKSLALPSSSLSQMQ